MMNTDQQITQPVVQHGICPSCAATTAFNLLGVQQWPEKVAQLAGIPAIQTVWQCDKCLTTLMEPSIIKPTH